MPRPKLRKLREYSLRDLLVVGLPLLLLLFAGFWLASRFIKPAPPDHLVLGSGGAYQLYAARYREILGREGIELRELASAGSIENLERLMDEGREIDAAFIQGGTAAGVEAKNLVALGSLYYEPLWVFYRHKDELDRLTQLQGRRIAVGPEGSGTRKLALELLEANGIAGAPTQLSPAAGLAAVRALQQGRVDAVFVVGPARSATVWSLLYSDNVKLMSMGHAEAYTRRFPYLSKLVLPKGGIDLQRDVPSRDVTLVAPVAMMVARESTHPALIDLLLQSMSEAHADAGLFQKAGEFPKATQVDFPLSKQAERYYRSGKPFLQRYLPFWIATFLDRILVMVIPVIALLIPVMRVAPSLYSWRVRSRVYRWYGELKFLERDVADNANSRSQEEWLAQLDRIERGVERIPTPLAFADHVYTLRSHIGMVRKIILRRTATSPETPESMPS
jgi:TRAP-type uncharacterized transport system substrate-binding protein